MKKFVSLLLVLIIISASVAAVGEAPSIAYGDSVVYPTLEAATWSGGRLKLTIGGYKSDFVVINGAWYLRFYPYVVVNGEKYTCVETEDFYSNTPSFYFQCADAPEEVWIELLTGEGEPVLLAQSPEVVEAAPDKAEPETIRNISPMLNALALGMSYADVQALDTALVASASKDGSKFLSGELESWGVPGGLEIYFDANDTLCEYTWYCQIGMSDCTVLEEKYCSETAKADSEAVYMALCTDMGTLAGVEADEVTPLSYSSDGGQYMMMEWNQGTPQRTVVWAANPLHYFFCRFTVSAE